MEALTRGVLQALGIHSATGEDGLVLGGEVFADYGDDAHIGEVTRGECEIGGRATETAFALALGGLDGVECNTAYYKNGRGFSFRFRKCTCAIANPTWFGLRLEWLPDW